MIRLIFSGIVNPLKIDVKNFTQNCNIKMEMSNFFHIILKKPWKAGNFFCIIYPMSWKWIHRSLGSCGSVIRRHNEGLDTRVSNHSFKGELWWIHLVAKKFEKRLIFPKDFCIIDSNTQKYFLSVIRSIDNDSSLTTSRIKGNT